GNYLGRAGVPVRLVVVFDAVNAGRPVGPGIAEVVNFYKPNGHGRIIGKSAEFTGKLVNVDLSDKKEIGHLNIDKMSDLHDEVVAMVLGIFDAP
ncbi:MAG: lipase, partial [bacterium]|nr:lipase [bacterium]